MFRKGTNSVVSFFSLSLHANLGLESSFLLRRNKKHPCGSFFHTFWKREDRGMSLSLHANLGLESSFLLRRNKKYPYGSFLLPGGSERIRTSDTLLYTRVPGVLLQPLGHASVWNDYNRYRSFFPNMNYGF